MDVRAPMRSCRHRLVALPLLGLALFAPACGGSKKEANGAAGAKSERVADIPETIDRFKAKDPTVGAWFEKSAGYFVIPTVGEGAFIVGGGHGKGEAFEKGAFVGTVSVSELSVGAQVGGQSYSELAFFEKPGDFAKLKQGTFEFDAAVTAVAAEKGAAKNAAFVNGTTIFVMPKKGLMATAAVTGQHFAFTPAK